MAAVDLPLLEQWNLSVNDTLGTDKCCPEVQINKMTNLGLNFGVLNREVFSWQRLHCITTFTLICRLTISKSKGSEHHNSIHVPSKLSINEFRGKS
jgi:hypothetical protein